MRANSKSAISKVAKQFEAWSDVVEGGLNSLEQRFKGKAVFATFHTDVKDTVDAFADCVELHEKAIADIRKSFNAFEAEADANMDQAENAAKAALAMMDENMP